MNWPKFLENEIEPTYATTERLLGTVDPDSIEWKLHRDTILRADSAAVSRPGFRLRSLEHRPPEVCNASFRVFAQGFLKGSRNCGRGSVDRNGADVGCLPADSSCGIEKLRQISRHTYT